MPSVDMAHARTAERDPNRAAEELCNQLGSAKPKLVVMYASRDRDQRALNRAVRERLPAGTRLVGATTGGEIDRDGMHAQYDGEAGAITRQFVARRDHFLAAVSSPTRPTLR